jgi:hypothetical protein
VGPLYRKIFLSLVIAVEKQVIIIEETFQLRSVLFNDCNALYHVLQEHTQYSFGLFCPLGFKVIRQEIY